MIAISKSFSRDEYHIGDTTNRRSGVYRKDGTLIRGDQVLESNMAAFCIWAQSQNVNIKNQKLLDQWNKDHPEQHVPKLMDQMRD
jgi:hypothetical protein